MCVYAYDYRKHNTGSTASYVIICLFLIAIAGLRYRIGGDSVLYEASYKGLPTLADIPGFKFSSTRYEPGYVVFSSIPRFFSSDFTYFQIFHAFVVNVVVFWFAYKNTKNKFIAVTLYYVCLYLNLNAEVLREALAVCCFLLAWPFFRDGKWILYYLVMALGCTFHVSAFITLVLPLFVIPGIRYFFQLRPYTLVMFIVVFAVSLILQRKVFVIIETLNINDTMVTRAQDYAKSSFGGMSLNLTGMIESIIRSILVPLAALYYMKQRMKSEEDEKIVAAFRKLEILIITGLYFAVITLVIPIATRFNNYIAMYNYVLIASCFFTTVKVHKKRFRLQGSYWTAILLLVLIINFKGYFASTYGGESNRRYMLYYPYSSRLEPEDNPNREVILRFFRHMN